MNAALCSLPLESALFAKSKLSLREIDKYCFGNYKLRSLNITMHNPHLTISNLLEIPLVQKGLINRGSYMSAHVLLNLLNELGKRDKMRGLPSILSLLRNEFNKFNNSRARMLDSIYHMTNTLKSHFWRKNVIILSL